MIEPDWSKLSPADAQQLKMDEVLFGFRCVETGEDNVPHRVDPIRLTFDPVRRSYTISDELEIIAPTDEQQKKFDELMASEAERIKSLLLGR